MARVLNFKVLIEQDKEGYFIASVPSVPGCHTQGETYEGVLKNIKEVIELCLDVAQSSPKYKAKVDFPDGFESPRFLGISK